MQKYLIEIKYRFFLIVIAWCAALIVSYIYKESMLFIITQSTNFFFKNYALDISYFIFTEITEIFTIYTILSYFVAFQIGIIYFFFHFFLFFSPAFFKKEYKKVKKILIFIFLTWIFSSLISNCLIIPFIWNFFLSFQKLSLFKPIDLYFETKLLEYIEFYISVYYGCFFYLQIFLFILFLLNYNSRIISAVPKIRKIYYYIFLILVTIITPPDIFSQLCITFIFILCYELSFFISIYQKYIIILTR